jgi:hypothetical protein
MLRIVSCCYTSAEIYQFMASLDGSVKKKIHIRSHRFNSLGGHIVSSWRLQ